MLNEVVNLAFSLSFKKCLPVENFRCMDVKQTSVTNPHVPFMQLSNCIDVFSIFILSAPYVFLFSHLIIYFYSSFVLKKKFLYRHKYFKTDVLIFYSTMLLTLRMTVIEKTLKILLSLRNGKGKYEQEPLLWFSREGLEKTGLGMANLNNLGFGA